MLVWMKGAALPIDRSTWLSAARCITAAGRNSAIACAMRAPSAMSACRKVKPGRPSQSRSERRSPA
jgi:hypothetical protein